MAAALAEMAAAFALGRERHAAVAPRMREVRERAAGVRRRAAELAEAELTSYAPVLAALGLPAGDPARAERVRAALLDACGPPLAIAEAAAEAADLAAETARDGNPHVAGDAHAGVVLAEAAAAAAARLAAVNATQAGEPAVAGPAAAAAARAARRRAELPGP